MKIQLHTRTSQIGAISVFILLLVFSSWLVVNRAMLHVYDHDENQFIASAYLFGIQGLLPYRDYPFFHTPNLVFIYAPLLRYSVHKLLSIRFLSAFFGISTVLLIFSCAYFLLSHMKKTTRILLSLAASVYLLANPLFAYTSGRAWNHDLPVLLLLISAILHFTSVRQKKFIPWEFGAGLFAAFAIGTRSSFALASLALPIATFFLPQLNKIEFVKRNAYLLLGGFAGLLPSLILFFLAPQKFIFGNLEYAFLNTEFRILTEFDRGMTIFGKLIYLKDDILSQPNNLLLTLTVLIVLFIPAWTGMRKNRKLEFGDAFALSLIILNFIGSLLPTPAYYQYFYAPVPFTILGIIYGIGRFQQVSSINKIPNPYATLFILATITSAMYGFQDVPEITKLNREESWFPLRAHLYGEKIHNIMNKGRILTLAPLYAIEAGKEIYPEFAVSPFTFRISPLLDQEEREAFDIVGLENLNDFTNQNPPDGILVRQSEIEAPFLELAKNNYYTPNQISPVLTLWISPKTP